MGELPSSSGMLPLSLLLVKSSTCIVTWNKNDCDIDNQANDVSQSIIQQAKPRIHVNKNIRAEMVLHKCSNCGLRRLFARLLNSSKDEMYEFG